MVDVRYWSMRCQLSMNLLVSMLVKNLPGLGCKSWEVDGVEVNVLQLFDEVENITLSQVVREGGWDELV